MSPLLRSALVFTLGGLGLCLVGPAGLDLLPAGEVFAADGPLPEVAVGPGRLGRLASPWVLPLLTAGLALWLATRGALRGQLGRRRFLVLAWLAGVVLSLSASQLRGGSHLARTVHFQGYASDAALFDGPLDLLATFEQRHDELLPHSRTHPPGPLLLAQASGALARGVARLVPDEGGFSGPAVLELFLAGNLGGLLVVLLAWLWLWPLERLTRRLAPGEPRAPVLAVALGASLACLHGIAPLADVLHPLLVVAAAACLVSERRAAAVAGGLLGGLLLLMAYGNLVAGPVLLGLVLLGGRGAATRLGLAAVGLLACWCLVALLGFDYLAGLELALAHHAGGVNAQRDRALFLVAGPYTFALWVGFPVVLGALAALGGTGSRALTGAGWVLAGTLVLLVASGLSRGETERLWLPLVPFLVVLAAVAWGRAERPAREPLAAVVLGLAGVPLLAVLSRLYA